VTSTDVFLGIYRGRGAVARSRGRPGSALLPSAGRSAGAVLTWSITPSGSWVRSISLRTIPQIARMPAALPLSRRRERQGGVDAEELALHDHSGLPRVVGDVMAIAVEPVSEVHIRAERGLFNVRCCLPSCPK